MRCPLQVSFSLIYLRSPYAQIRHSGFTTNAPPRSSEEAGAETMLIF